MRFLRNGFLPALLLPILAGLVINVLGGIAIAEQTADHALAVNNTTTPAIKQTSETDIDYSNQIVVNLATRKLELYKNGHFVAEYDVGVGRAGYETPAGEFKVIRKVKDPLWEHPYKPAGEVRVGAGRNNPLGTRWMGFHRDDQGEYGIHGTPNVSSVGKYSSHGCIRMRIKDAEALFEQLPMGAAVTVVKR